MCRLPRQICLFLAVVAMAVATPQTRRPLHLDSRPLQDHEQLELSDADTRLLSYYLNTRRDGIADLLSDENPEELDQPPHEHAGTSPYDLAYLYQQLDLVTTIRDLISGKHTSDREGLGLPRDSLVAEDFPRSNHPTSEPQDYDILELFERMHEGNNMGARQRRASNTARDQRGRQEADGKFTLKNGKEEVNPEESCKPGRYDWPTCRFLTKFEVESFRIEPQQVDEKKEGLTRDEEKKVEQGSIRMYGDDEKDEGSKDVDPRIYGTEAVHLAAEKSGSRRKREANNVEVWKEPLEGVDGKRVPDFHSWGGKRAAQVDLDEIYNLDSSAIGDKRAPEFNSWGGKRAPGFSNLAGQINDEANFRGRKGMLAYNNNWEGKRGPSFNSWGGKRSPSFNSWGGKRTPSFNSWGGKRAPEFNSWGGKRAPEFNSWGGKRAPEFNSWGGKRAPEFNSWGGKRAHEFTSWGGTPSFHSWGGKRAPEFNSWGGKRNQAFNSWGGKRSSRTLQKLLGNMIAPEIAAATNDDQFGERGLETVKVKVGKRDNMDRIRAMVKAPNLPVIRSRAAGFYPWGGKRSDSSFLQE